MDEEKQKEIGNILHSWVIPEYEVHERGTLWYIIASLIIAFLIFYAIITKNFTFAPIILLFALLVLLHHRGEPIYLPFAITDKGILINEQFYLYEKIESFWIVSDPPVTHHIYFQFKSAIRPPLGVSLAEEDHEELRQTLGQFIFEDKEKNEEPLSEWLWRILKI